MFTFTRTGRLKKHLKEIQKHLQHIVYVNDDILSTEQKDNVREIISEAAAIDPAKDADAAEKFIERAPIRAAKILPRLSFPTLREYLDILAVAFMVAFGVRGLFLQPFKIPTSSMQPTLFGIHYIEDNGKTLPRLPSPVHLALFGTEPANLTIRDGGYIEKTGSYNKFALWPQTQFKVAGTTYELPGDLSSIEKYYPALARGFCQKDQTIAKGWLSTGDHLFVDRWTLHFREPKRGDVIVFNTEGITNRGRELSGYYYIKRLVGLPCDTLKIKDEILYVKPKGEKEFQPITEFSEKFKKLYSGMGGYHGHHAERDLENQQELLIPEDCYFAMGDNTFNSSDSRDWGFVPRKNLVGLGFFVFWPLSRRWGPVDVRSPVQVKSTEISNGQQDPAMTLQ